MNRTLLYKSIIIIIALSFILGGYALEQLGIQYASSGGSAIFKIHAYSYITLILFALLSINIGYNNILISLGEFYKIWLLSLSLLIFVIIYGVALHGLSGMAYLVNTFLSPLLIIPLLFNLSVKQLERVLRILAYFLLLNSVTSICEFIFKARVWELPYEQYGFFRSSAFLTHPLNNALVTISISLMLMNRTKAPQFLYLFISTIALFAYGGRASLAVFLLSSFIISMPLIWRFFTVGVYTNKLKLALLLLTGYISIIIFYFIAMETGITDRIMSKLYIDGSATARFDIFYLLKQLSFSEWIYGASSNLRSSIEIYLGISIIENYIVGWIFSFGLLGAIPLFLAFSLPLLFFFMLGDIYQRVSISAFFLASLSNNSLTTKTPALLFLYITLAILFLISHKHRSVTSTYKS